MRSDLIPDWAKDPKIVYKTVSARVETVDTAPIIPTGITKRQRLIPVHGFYEWKKKVEEFRLCLMPSIKKREISIGPQIGYAVQELRNRKGTSPS